MAPAPVMVAAAVAEDAKAELFFPEKPRRVGMGKKQMQQKHEQLEVHLPLEGSPRPWRLHNYYDPRPGASAVEVLVSGPLQRRVLGVAWRWRWCVLTPTSLQVFKDEAHWEQAAKTPPLEIHEIDRLAAFTIGDVGCGSTFQCLDRNSGRTRISLRSGDQGSWEEVAAAALWVDMLNMTAQICSSAATSSTATPSSGAEISL
mmetsp:Transcript_109313/g.244235  ORF Transcript_109313/g.244235 Transcript_109313/m.244235 type:complete len:202 (+) Transcript_109313:123-728(+)